MITIEPMGRADIPFARSLTDIEQWGHMEEDFGRFIDLNPAGCLVAWLDGARAGIVTSAVYGDYAFLGNLIVRRDCRTLGMGRRLMEAVIAGLDQQGVKTIELDGVFGAVEAYRRFGFRDKYLSLRFTRPAGSGPGHAAAGVERRVDVREILRFDRDQTGIDRSGFIEHLLRAHHGTTRCLGRRILTLLFFKSIIAVNVNLLRRPSCRPEGTWK